MNILVIGNGFDLAHGLPTRYGDFLKWVEIFIELNSYDESKREKKLRNITEPIYGYFSDFFKKRNNKKIYIELKELVLDNGWIYYFTHFDMYRKENWIDFEKEISKVIQWMDTRIVKMEKEIFEANNKDMIQACNWIKDINSKFSYKIKFVADSKKDKVQEITDRLYVDLNRFIRAFEIYLTDYVEQMELKFASNDIRSILNEIEESSYIKQCKILSFNYTNTFERFYGIWDDAIDFEYDFVHGSANISNTLETNNMVLGIDEYLKDDRKNCEIYFIMFKKYYQRIYKQTGCEYKNWIDKIRNSDDFREIESRYKKEFPLQIPFEYFKDKHYAYIFGHSLDITDKDIIRDLILNDNIYTIIFYKDTDHQGQEIENLVKVIGQDELIRRTSGITKTIEFKLQENMMKYDKSKGIWLY